MTQYFGRAKITADGLLLDTEKGAKLDLGGAVRKERAGSHRVGYSEELKPAAVECEIGLTKDTPIEKLRNLTGATVQFQCDTGQVFMIRNAFNAEPFALTEGEGGKVKLRLVGDPSEATT